MLSLQDLNRVGLVFSRGKKTNSSIEKVLYLFSLREF